MRLRLGDSHEVVDFNKSITEAKPIPGLPKFPPGYVGSFSCLISNSKLDTSPCRLIDNTNNPSSDLQTNRRSTSAQTVQGTHHSDDQSLIIGARKSIRRSFKTSATHKWFGRMEIEEEGDWCAREQYALSCSPTLSESFIPDVCSYFHRVGCHHRTGNRTVRRERRSIYPHARECS